MKDIKDYLFLYLGCEVQYFFKTRSGIPEKIYERRTAKLIGIGQNGMVQTVTISGNGFTHVLRTNDIKPILRPLSSMTEEELSECGNLDYDFSDNSYLNKWSYKSFETVNSPNQFVWLLARYFDLFDLTEAGLAIDKTKI